MLIRIVRMEFEPSKVADFKELFEEVKGKIITFPGCHHVELRKDASLSNVFYTFSKWENEGALEAYRISELFTATWIRTKALFNGKPLAYSLIKAD
jgi:quinol monooxygenase YgiN